MTSTRKLALDYVTAALAEKSEDEVLQQADSLSTPDRALFQELSHGVLREYRFLEWTVSQFAKRPPKGKALLILLQGAYQLLFLDRVPDYAVFSEAKALAAQFKLTDPESKFVHGVLKSIQRQKVDLLEQRQTALKRAQDGSAPQSALEWAVLNADKSLFHALSWKGEALAARALAAMKEKPALVGFLLPGFQSDDVKKMESAIAPMAAVAKPSALGQGFQVQGEASQWVCGQAAQWLQAKAKTKQNLQVVEMTSGKGGKLLGTLAAWTQLGGGDPEKVPAVMWTAADVSDAQLDLLERSVLPLVSKIWPQVEVHIHHGLHGLKSQAFDLVWLDAPCTGFGTLAKLPQIALTRGRHAEEEAMKLSKLQRELCAQGAELCAPSGAFLYTVCTTTKAETHGLMDYCKERLGRSPREEQFLWPGSEPAPHAEGFFMASF